MVVAIPGDIAQPPSAGEATEIGGGFEERDLVSPLAETLSDGEPEHAAPQDC